MPVERSNRMTEVSMLKAKALLVIPPSLSPRSPNGRDMMMMSVLGLTLVPCGRPQC